MITLGGFAITFPEGPRYQHVVFSSDPVPVLAERLSSELIVMGGEIAEDVSRYMQARYTVDDGPAPLLVDVQVGNFSFSRPGWQHNLQAYLKVLPTESAVQSIVQSPLAPQPEVTILEGHASWVSSVAWSPDGQQLASGDYDGTVRVWDVVTGTTLIVLEHPDLVKSVVWSPDGGRLASAGRNGMVQVWDTATWTVLAVLEGHTREVNGIAWSPDGARLASGSDDRTVRVWDATTGTMLAVLEGHTSGAFSVAWSPDGGHLASGDWGVLRIWDTATWTALAVLEEHTGGGGRNSLVAGWEAARLDGWWRQHAARVGYGDVDSVSRPGRAYRPGDRRGLVTGWEVASLWEP